MAANDGLSVALPNGHGFVNTGVEVLDPRTVLLRVLASMTATNERPPTSTETWGVLSMLSCERRSAVCPRREYRF
jgi:hypothetical protein